MPGRGRKKKPNSVRARREASDRLEAGLEEMGLCLTAQTVGSQVKPPMFRGERREISVTYSVRQYGRVVETLEFDSVVELTRVARYRIRCPRCERFSRLIFQVQRKAGTLCQEGEIRCGCCGRSAWPDVIEEGKRWVSRALKALKSPDREAARARKRSGDYLER